MADDLQAVVQRMIDAGESEENIATVIKSAPTFQPRNVLAEGRTAAATGGVPEGVDPTQSAVGQLNTALEPMAHPQTAGDMAGLLIPNGIGEVAPYFTSAAKEGWNNASRLRDVPGQILKTLTKRAFDPRTLKEIQSEGFNKLPLAQQMERLPESSPLPGRGQLTPPDRPPTPTSGPPSIDELRKAGVGRGSIAEIQGQPWSPSFTPIASHAHAAPLPEPPSNVAAVPVSTPLGAPHVTNLNPKYPWTPEQSSQIRLGMQDWHSGAAPGSKAARGAQNLHIEDANLDQRYRQLLDDPKAAWLLPLLAPQVRNALLSQMKSRPNE